MPELHFRPKESEGPPMKKRLISLLVALCMAVTLLPVSAITAWAEESSSNLKPLQIQSGYPVLNGITPTINSDEHEIYTGKDWSYDGTAKVLTIAPESPTTYDLTDLGSIRQDPISILCSAIIWAIFIRKTHKPLFCCGHQPTASWELSSIYSAIRRNSSAYLNFTLMFPPS